MLDSNFVSPGVNDSFLASAFFRPYFWGFVDLISVRLAAQNLIGFCQAFECRPITRR